MENIFHGVKARLDEEEITELLSRPGIRIERIVSTGQASPPDFWYDQPNDEWVIVLTGSAGLAVEGEAETRLGWHNQFPVHRRWYFFEQSERPGHVLDGEAVGHRCHAVHVDLGKEVADHRQAASFRHAPAPPPTGGNPGPPTTRPSA